MPRDDGELLDAWSTGDQGAARELFDRHFDPLFRFFYGKVATDAEDLVQETLLGCLKSPAQFRAVASFRSYLFGAARNVLKQHYRRKRRKDDPLEFGTVSIQDLGVGPVTALAQKSEHRLLLEGLRRLPLDQQIALELYLWEGMTAAELGVMFEMSEEAARSRVRRARARLKELLEELADSPNLLESTLGDLDGWAQQIRNRADEHSTPVATGLPAAGNDPLE